MDLLALCSVVAASWPDLRCAYRLVPTFAYWKGMIKPHRSDGLFDFADILPTALSLAGVPGAKLADLYPKTTYIDGVDQASFLVADDGLSARRSRPYTLNQYFAAIRVDEFKYV